MNPEFSSNNAGNIRFTNSPPNTGPPGTTGIYSPINPQLRPRMEQFRPPGRIENNSSQPNYQPHPNNPLQYQQLQQNHQRLNPNFMQQRPQQNLRFPSNEDIVRSQINSNYNNNNLQSKGPGIPFDGQRMHMTPPIRYPNPQQQVRHPFNSPRGEIPFNQTNLLNQSLKTEPSKAPVNQPQINYQNVSPMNENSNSASNPGQVLGQSAIKFSTDDQPGNISSPHNIERKSDFEKASLLRREESKTESDESIESNYNEDCDLKSYEKIPDNQTEKKKSKENKKSILNDDSITSGMVLKNIKFFEQNDTAKKPLRPNPITAEKTDKIAKIPTNITKSDRLKNEFESGVDETPVVHPNLGSIFQIPRKVAKIPYLKEKKRPRKFKSKRTIEETSNKKYVYEKPTFSQFLKPKWSYSYKLGNKKNQNVKTYSPEEELLSFFENTNSWRKLSRYGSKSNDNAKDKVIHKPTTNGDIPTPKKTPSKLQTPSKKNLPTSPVKTPLKSPGTPGTPGAKLLPKTPESPTPPTPLIKKVPMNKIQVGAAPSPNLKTIRSKVGSLANTTHKPGGGNVKIESHKIDLGNVQPRTEAKNDQYKPSGGDKKIQQVKLQWSAKSKVGSLENATYKPAGGDKKIESVKLDFKEKAKSKVGSKDNVKHVPGGGNVKIENQKLEFRAQSKVGSLDNVKHKPGGGDVKIFDDKTYLRQVSGNSSEGRASGTQAYRNLSIERELRTRSAPGTPGRKTSIKLKKITSIDNSEDTPKIKKITEVVVTSQTPKINGEIAKSPTKVKVTYSKTSLKSEGVEGGVKLIKTPAKHNAPVLKPSLSQKDIFDDSETGKQLKFENELHLENTTGRKNIKNPEIFKQSSESPDLFQGKSFKGDDSEGSKFLQTEMLTQEKVGEIWRERNVSDKSNLPNNQPYGEQRKEQIQTSILSNPKIGNHHQQFRFPNPDIKSDNQIINTERNFYSSQNFQAEQLSQNPSFSQMQNSQRSSIHSSIPEEYRISALQPNQFRQNPYK